MDNDLISRQAILKHIEKIRWGVQMMDDTHRASIIMNGMYLCEKAVRNQPSTQPERQKGEWIYGEDEYGIDGYHCNKCGFFVPWDYAHTFINYIKDYNFCPNCGADMRETE